jgi:hypothetical protein
MLFKAPKKQENTKIAEEIKITNVRNFYNDSLENDPEYNEEEEEEVEEKKEEPENNEDKEKNVNIEEIIEVKKNDISSKEFIKDSKDSSLFENIIEVNKGNDNNVKLPDDKTSFCHFIYFEGEDIDISRKKAIDCYEQTNNFVLFKKFSKVKKLIFIEEQFLYILKDFAVNKTDEKIRRISKKFDLGKLCNIEAKEENKKYVYKLQFLKNDYFDRETRIFIFEEDEGNLFYDLLSETLEKIESTFFSDLSDDENEEEEEEDDVDKIGDIEDSMNDVDMSAKHMNQISFNDKNNDLISSSRKKII